MFVTKLIVTFLTLKTTYLSCSYAITFTFFNFLVVFFKNTVVVVVLEINFGFSVTVDTPSHRQRLKLFHLVHFLNRTVTSLTLYITNIYVLRMVKVNVVGQVVHFYPFDWSSFDITFFVTNILFGSRIPSCIFIQFLNFSSTIYFITLIVV